MGFLSSYGTNWMAKAINSGLRLELKPLRKRQQLKK